MVLLSVLFNFLYSLYTFYTESTKKLLMDFQLETIVTFKRMSFDAYLRIFYLFIWKGEV